MIRDIVLCNDFDLFVTFTFNPKRVDRFSFKACFGVLSRWLRHEREINANFQYLIVPEQHRSGAWHFHGLFRNYSGVLADSGLKMNGKPIFNIQAFHSGFTTAVKIHDKDTLVRYIVKYITKDFSKPGRKFFCSQNLTRPVRELNSIHNFQDYEKVFENSSCIYFIKKL